MRFDFFCKAALEFLLQTQRQPDILHAHDWQTAHVAKSYWDEVRGRPGAGTDSGVAARSVRSNWARGGSLPLRSVGAA